MRTLAVAGLGLSAMVAGAAPALDDDVLARAATDHAARAVLVDLRLAESPTPDDYEIATRLFSIVSELAPGDADLARLQTAAAFGTGDPQLLERATARIVSLDPADTVAQLRLITARIGQKQTVEERLRMYETLLGPRGVSLDPTIRSRLALDAALIYREIGDVESFGKMLTLATDLDRTNKEAVHLATSYVAEYLGDNPAGLLEMQLNLMYADPIDPNVHFGIARLLAVEGATLEASRFYGNGISILSRAGLLEPRHRVESLALRWLIEGPQVVLAEIDRELRLLRDNARIIYERDKERDMPDRLLTPPEEAFLDPLYEKIRIIAALDAQNTEAVRTGLAELDAYARHQFSEVQEATKLDDQQTRRRAFAEFANSLVALQFMRALANVELEAMAAQVPQLVTFIGEDEWNKLRQPLEAWVSLRANNLERTREILDNYGPRDSIMRVCEAELLAAEGNTRRAAEEYERIMRVDPFIPYGAWARSRAMELTGRTDPVTEAGAVMRRLVAEVPRSIDTLTTDPAAVMTLSIRPTATQFDSTNRSRVAVTVRNVTPFPLSIGPNRTISSRVLLGVSADNPEQFVASPQPVVVDLDRRFRLLPGDEVSVEVDLERGLNGIIFDADERGVIRERWQGWQDPQLGRSAAYQAGPYSLSDSTPKFMRSTRDASRLPIGELVTMVADASSPEEIVAAIEAAAARLWRKGLDEGGLVAALRNRYENAGPLERLLMVSCLPASAQVPAMKPFDETVRLTLSREAIRAVDSPAVVAAMTLLTRVSDAGDPLFASAADSGDDHLSAVARLLDRRIAERRPAFATTGPGVASLEGASKGSVVRGKPTP